MARSFKEKLAIGGTVAAVYACLCGLTYRYIASTLGSQSTLEATASGTAHAASTLTATPDLTQTVISLYKTIEAAYTATPTLTLTPTVTLTPTPTATELPNMISTYISQIPIAPPTGNFGSDMIYYGAIVLGCASILLVPLLIGYMITHRKRQ